MAKAVILFFIETHELKRLC